MNLQESKRFRAALARRRPILSLQASRPVPVTAAARAPRQIGKVSSIQQVDETTELMVISQFDKLSRIDTKTIRAAGRAAMGVKLLDLDDADKVAAAVTIPNEEKNEEEKVVLQ